MAKTAAKKPPDKSAPSPLRRLAALGRGKPARKWLERGKSALIALLLVSALLLIGQTDTFSGLQTESSFLSPVLGWFRDGGSEPAGGSEEEESLVGAATPMVMAVTAERGFHCGIRYEKRALNESFSLVAASLGEVLGSMDVPVEVSEQAWKDALSGTGVFLDYIDPVPLSVLAGWLGTDMRSEAGLESARRLCLAVEGETISLYYIRASDGRFFCCATTLPADSLSGRLGTCQPNGAYFAWEADVPDKGLDSYCLFLEDLPALYSLDVKNPFRANLSGEDLLPAFEMNRYVVSPYKEADGTEVYVEGDRILRLYTDGTLSFRQSGQEVLPVAKGAEAAADAALKLVLAATVGRCGEAGIRFSGLTYDADADTYVVRFEYTAAGIPVRCGEESAFTVFVADGAIVRASMTFREIGFGADVLVPLPQQQAAAIVAVTGGGEPLLSYLLEGAGAKLDWVIR